ncbi:MAG: S8 family serine peptidase [Actinomycetota bacterium]|nr:S8 family serine peptidase [Actinomycetota bacterium]
MDRPPAPSRRTTAAVTVAVAAAAAASLAAPPGLPASGADNGAVVSVMVAARPGAQVAAREAVARWGGKVTARLGIIDAHVAQVPARAVSRLAADPSVSWVVPDRSVTLSHTSSTDMSVGPTSLHHIVETVRAKQVWGAGFTGAGVDVAVLDSGVVPVDGLRAPGKVVNGPDLSFESGAQDLRHLDTYGHGTHMAGIIAGRDDAVSTPVRSVGHEDFVGVAPDARVVNLKLADSSGATDVSQVIAAIDWVVQHGRTGGLNIRVINLSFGTDGVQDYRLDPLAHAVEEAWRRGVVVVAAAGNDGYGDAKMNNPAYDPYVIAVAGGDGRGTVEPEDDLVAAWSSRGDGTRRPDLVAPGSSVVSLRDPGSSLDLAHSGARVGERFFRGSGTSQAAAVVSGAAALLLQQRPQLTPDQVKALLTSSARPLPLADPAAQGAGMLDVKAAAASATPVAVQDWPRSTGTGSLELSRGTRHVTVDGTPVVGEQSVFLTAWQSYAWLTALSTGGSWTGGSWTGNSWTGNSWTGGSWAGNSWTGNSWTGNSWTGNSWTGNSWTGNSWTGNSWTGNSWTGNSWTGNSWTGGSWSSAGW